MDYDFGKVFNRFDVNPKDGKLDAKQAEAAMKAGYFAAVDMDKSIFEIHNRSNSKSRETYKKGALQCPFFYCNSDVQFGHLVALIGIQV